MRAAAELCLFDDKLNPISPLSLSIRRFLINWNTIDPISSILIANLFGFPSLKMPLDACNTLTKGVPKHMNTMQINKNISTFLTFKRE